MKQKFTQAELEQIGKSKHRLMRIQLLERHLENLYQCLQSNIDELNELGYRGNKLSEAPGNGCKPRRCSPTIAMHIEEMIDEKDELKCKIKKAEIELKKIVKTLHKMPTKLYSESLIKKYITRIKVTKKMSYQRYNHLDDAYLEFYHTWKN